jgi:hypothetical protein
VEEVQEPQKKVTSSCNMTNSNLDWERFLEKEADDTKQPKQAHIKEDSDNELDDRQRKLKDQVAELELELEL